MRRVLKFEERRMAKASTSDAVPCSTPLLCKVCGAAHECARMCACLEKVCKGNRHAVKSRCLSGVTVKYGPEASITEEQKAGGTRDSGWIRSQAWASANGIFAPGQETMSIAIVIKRLKAGAIKSGRSSSSKASESGKLKLAASKAKKV